MLNLIGDLEFGNFMPNSSYRTEDVSKLLNPHSHSPHSRNVPVKKAQSSQDPQLT